VKKVNNKSDYPYSLSQDITQIILESISDGVFTVDPEWRITSFNQAAEKITGIPRKEAIGKPCCEVFRSNMCEKNCALRKTMQQGIPFVDSATYIVNYEKKRIPVTVCTSVLRDEDGNIIGGVETFRDMSVIEQLRRELDGRYKIDDIVSNSHSMEKIIQLLPKISASDSSVLIQGDTGTGKELIARAIHNNSARSDQPFVAINCGALPDSLLESELFGYKAGAFTGATKDKPGHFAMANNGTIFLDEIGDVSPAFQVPLLRVLQEKSFIPLGGTKAEKTNARVLAATNKDLKELVAEGTFRKDLFYRVNVIRLQLPTLQERKADIPLLVDHFIEKLNAVKKKSISGITPDALEMLMAHDYPGNIRELENIIEHAFILCTHDKIGTHCLPETVRPAGISDQPHSIKSSMYSTEEKIIRDTLQRHNYNRRAAAQELGIHPTTLFRKIKKLNIRLPEIDGRHSNSPAP